MVSPQPAYTSNYISSFFRKVNIGLICYKNLISVLIRKLFHNSSLLFHFIILLHFLPGLAFANGITWKEHRKFFLSIFRKVNIGVIRLEDLVADQVEKIVNEVKTKKGGKFDPSVMINLTIANVVLRIITGITYEWDNEEFLEVCLN